MIPMWMLILIASTLPPLIRIQIQMVRESRSGLGIRIRNQTGKNFPQKKKKLKKFHIIRLLFWAGGFSWNLNGLSKGLDGKIKRIKIYFCAAKAYFYCPTMN